MPYPANKCNDKKSTISRPLLQGGFAARGLNADQIARILQPRQGGGLALAALAALLQNGNGEAGAPPAPPGQW